ncbi:DUF3017 domain-containing protein [Streptomyces sp. NPDC053780]|uniref:DUF3017 domain-containing protein n=1 Tax=Streptomyces sp. NPDC053780 TaxID=3365715 RepID=UPI0037D2C96D
MPAEDTHAERPGRTTDRAQAREKAAVRADGAEGTEAVEGTEGVDRAPDSGDTAGSAGSAGKTGRPDRVGDASDPGHAEDAEDAEELVVRDPISAPDAQGRPKRATRRFPLFTRDTARPEGGGRAAAGDAPAPARQWPVLTVAGLAGIGLLITGLDVFRWGLVLVGVALLIGAALRWSVRDVGMLAVRSRFTDIVTYGVLGLAIAMLALMAQPHAPLKIPFLNDLLHFTVSS